MTRYPLLAAAALAVALVPALPASANHETFCVFVGDTAVVCRPVPDPVLCLQSTEQEVLCVPPRDGEASASSADDAEPICIYPYDGGWCVPTVRQVAEQVPGVPQYCMHPWDGSICTPTVRDVVEAVPSVEVTEFCVYPYDGGWCVPWVEVGS